MADVISLTEVQTSFTGFAEAKGASVDVAYADEALILSRCVLPMEFEIRPGDVLKGGVAIRGTVEQVEVRPYLLRLVCTNGAIMMRSSAGSYVATSDCTADWLSEAFTSACSKEALTTAAEEIRTMAGASFDQSFLLLSLMRSLHGFSTETPRETIRRMLGDGASGFSLMNAITSVARDTSDPETRWRLEAAGGAIPALLLSGPPDKRGVDALSFPALESDRDLQLA